MLSSRFFWKLYASYVLLLLVITLVIGSLLEYRVRATLIAELGLSLQNKCLLLEPFIRKDGFASFPGAMDEGLRAAGRESGIRLTLIAADGTVVADTEQDPRKMDNHRTRPEIQDAQMKEFGTTQRHSQTVGYSMLYVARAVRSGDTLLGTVRVAKPLEQVDHQLAAVHRMVVTGAAMGLLLAAGLGLLVARRVTRPMAEMRHVAETLRAGHYGSRVRNLPNDELGLLGDTLNRLGEELARQIAFLSRERAQLQAMVSGMVDGVFAIDAEERIIFGNQAASRLLGARDLGRPGQLIWEVVRIAGLNELLSRARTSDQPVQAEMVVRGDSSAETILDAHAAAFTGGETRGTVVVLHDITSLRRLETIRRDFVANVSHELKTPLTAIKGYVETLLTEESHDREVQTRFLTRIDQNVIRLTNLVNDLLSLARVESDAEKGALVLKPLDWRAVVEEAARLHEIAARGKGLALVLELPSAPVTVQGDVDGLTQILNNLLDNAIKFTSAPGTITVRVRTDGPRARLEVEDTGIGILEKHLDRIFERFYRVDKARSRELGGTGLGLSIVKHLTQNMNGQVRVESRAGVGSRFIVDLPLAQAIRPA